MLNDYWQLKSRVEKIENDLKQEEEEETVIQIILDFNRDGTNNPDKLYYLTPISMKDWKGR